ncbi:hypothetical protein THAOC_09051 [Thalassiosira oceanica]|uniref:Uncharacterized protein n=1 Tax=Thalassiosira oceanica TaxID=159749 RepID=K0STH1_THAOC|nr:hypothetical protein THAOC_09051 [Thalassiosira oceanica]|eukprot:EJK69668.1 hypothetical protein THAOC_09051 [Thalassiosira oceanica]
MPSRKKQKGKGKSMLKKEMRQFSNATPAEIIRGIHGGKPGAIGALAGFVCRHEGSVPYDELEHDGITEALLKNLQRCDESLASVFGYRDMVLLPSFCLSTLVTGATKSHNTEELIHAIMCRYWLSSVSSHDKQLLPFLGEAICWSQCCPDLVKGFQGSWNKIVPHESIISVVCSISHTLSSEHQDYGMSKLKAYKLLKTIGAVGVAKDSELPAIAGMIRSYGVMCHGQAVQKDRDMPTFHPLDNLADVIQSLLSAGCVDKCVMREMVELRDICPEFVARCTVRILCEHLNVLSDSRFAGALRSGLLAATLSICAELGRQGIYILAPWRGVLGDDEEDDDDDESYYHSEELARGIVDQLYRIRLHHETHKVIQSMTLLNYRGLEDKWWYIFGDAKEYVCANCLGTFDREALKWCKGTHMLEPLCSSECFKASWDAGACADFRYVVKKDDDKRMISLKRNILQAGCKVFRDNFDRIVREYKQGMAHGQGLTMAIDLREFPPRVSSGLFPVDPSDCVLVTFIAEDFRGFRDGLSGKVLKVRKCFLMKQGCNAAAIMRDG